jgi:predicted RecB family nuclease
MAMLSKSRYLAGCQCTRRLWLGCYGRELATEPDAARAWRFDAGSEIGRHARALFPGGVLVGEDAWRHGEAIVRTRQLLAAPAVPAIFEGAVAHAGVRIRADVLERLPGGAWGLREVKAAAHVKEVHLHDVAVQRIVLERAGLRVPSVEVIHVDPAYVRGAGDIDWPRFFKRVDVTAAIDPLLAAVPARVEALHRVCALADSPSVEPSTHCFSPHACEFWAHCTREKPVDWIFTLPGRPSPFEALRAAGVERIADIPDGFPLSVLQARVRDVLRSGREFVASDLGGALVPLGPPARYLDFETVNPAVPLYPGTRPYQQIPLQWSLHEIDATGRLTHREFLARGRDDPRRGFAERLLDAIGAGRAPVVVYSGFEARVLAEVAAALPDLASAIEAVRGRLVDLLPVVRRHVYHPAFAGSFSLKRVAPALADGFDYGALTDIADGGAASLALQRLASGDVTDAAEEAQIRGALLAYCHRDTLALVELHRALQVRAGTSRGTP